MPDLMTAGDFDGVEEFGEFRYPLQDEVVVAVDDASLWICLHRRRTLVEAWRRCEGWTMI